MKRRLTFATHLGTGEPDKVNHGLVTHFRIYPKHAGFLNVFPHPSANGGRNTNIDLKNSEVHARI